MTCPSSFGIHLLVKDANVPKLFVKLSGDELLGAILEKIAKMITDDCPSGGGQTHCHRTDVAGRPAMKQGASR